jgi:phosphoenolpyruvate carboxykinase (ATP)
MKKCVVTNTVYVCFNIEFIPNAKIPCTAGHPRNIILLTCDAFAVLPPVSRLTPAQASYHFISGYTAKVAGTEEGVTEPQATFSTCFGAPFLVWHPSKYATMLAEQMKEHNASAWLVNTGWTGGPYSGAKGNLSGGSRISLKHTRAIIDAIHSGILDDPTQTQYETYPVFGLQIPTNVPGVPRELLSPLKCWKGTRESYANTVEKLARLFMENYAGLRKGFAGGAKGKGAMDMDVDDEILRGGPQMNEE